MNKTIHIREAVTPEEVERFWQELHAYHARDIFPDPAEEDRAYFLDDSQYRAAVQRIHDREGDRCYYLLFRREGPGYRLCPDSTVPLGGRQVLRHGVLCAAGVPGRRDRHRLRRLLLDWAADRGAQYGELNAADPRRIRFWSRLGFRPNGRDEWGEPLMLRPPEQALPITVELLQDPGGLAAAEAGERLSGGDRRAAADGGEHRAAAGRRGAGAYPLPAGIPGLPGRGNVLRGRELLHLLLRAGSGAGGSVRGAGVPETGHRRQLTRSAQALCRERGVGSLTVCCAPCDEAMYQALGFNVPLGVSRSCLL